MCVQNTCSMSVCGAVRGNSLDLKSDVGKKKVVTHLAKHQSV
jgi:hypothetical protein